ncbi:hypothetical protein GCM10009022_01360 [Vreelandella titanicae]
MQTPKKLLNKIAKKEALNRVVKKVAETKAFQCPCYTSQPVNCPGELGDGCCFSANSSIFPLAPD